MLRWYLIISTWIGFITGMAVVQVAVCQTAITGKVLSADGSPVSSVVISIDPHSTQDIFTGTYENVVPAADGSYRVLLHDAGLYTITVRGVFHRSLSIPVLVYDQQSIGMNVLLLPTLMNSGHYFQNPEYLQWIRAEGNFNNYDFHTGAQFSLNRDGSISTTIPVTSDTVRYYVRGVTLGQGSSPLPPADEYHLGKNNRFESVLYSDLPEDSLEIRYVPGDPMPYNRAVPEDVNPRQIVVRGFLSFENDADAAWIEPLRMMRAFQQQFYIIERTETDGLSAQEQMYFQRKSAGTSWGQNLEDTLNRITEWLEEPGLHPEQYNLLALSYAGVLLYAQWMPWAGLEPGGDYEDREPDIDHAIILSIPETVTPVHPGWNRNYRLPGFLLELTDYAPQFREYFTEVVRYHPEDEVVKAVVLELISYYAKLYNRVEEIPVYRVIVERYGEGHLARLAHRQFQGVRVAGNEQ